MRFFSARNLKFWRPAFLPIGALLLGGCRSEPPPPGPTISHPVVVPRDDLERAMKFVGPKAHVVVIGPGATETMFALGAGAQLVGRDSGSDYPSAAQKVAVCGDFSGPSVEKVVALRPDLVIVQGETWDANRIENWQRKIGAPVAALSATSVKLVARDIEKIGAWLGRDAKAQALAMTLRRAAFQSPPQPKPSAFLEVSRSPLWTAGRGTLLSDVATRAGFQSIAAGISGYKAYSLEALAAHPPDVYIAPMEKPNLKSALLELRKLPGLNQLPAIKAGRVLVIDADLLLRPGPRLGQGIKQLRQYKMNEPQINTDKHR